MSPLHYAVFFGHIGCIQALFDAGADKGKQLIYINDSGRTIKTYTLLELTVIGNQYNAARLLLEQGLSITHLDDNLETVLHKACLGLKSDLVTLFVEWTDSANADNKIDIDKFTLHFHSSLNYAISAETEKKPDKFEDPVNDKKT